MHRIIFLLAGFWLFFSTPVLAQCELYDFNGDVSDSPYWYNCSGNSFTLNIQSPHNLGPWSINWGDGSPLETGSSLTPPNVISHNYTAAVDTFIVTFTETSTGCSVQGVLVMEEPTSASIQIPVGGLTQACAPQTMEFINSSTNTSQTTTFIWDFGDNSEPLVFDYTNLGQTISHTYEKGTVDCETAVTLIAENHCNTVQGGPSQATFSPIRIWDIDSAHIASSAMMLCYPDTVVTLTNTTERNCLLQGNIYQRYEYWNLGNYWGTGHDSIIDWTPWPPTFPRTIAYPGVGTYTATLLDSNLCGIDVASITIQIVPPPTADITSSIDTICIGQTVTFYNNSSSDASVFRWNFDDGSGWLNSGASSINRVYNTPGNYNIGLVAQIPGTTNSCSDTAWVPLVVLPGPEANILLDNDNACDSLLVNFTDGSSANSVTWNWNFGNGETSNLENPPFQTYDEPGAYNVQLEVSSANGCSDTDFEIVHVYQTPDPNFIPESLCENEVSGFLDASTSMGGDPIISWTWDFGDGGSSNLQHPEHLYTSSGTFAVSLTVATAHCSATETFDVTVEPAPEADFSVNAASGCSPHTVDFTNLTIGGNNYTWRFGDGGISIEDNPSHTFVNLGMADSVYTVQMVASTAFGCTDTVYMDITVSPNAIAGFTAVASPACAPIEASFTNSSVGAIGYEWNFGDGTPVVNETNPSHLYQNNTLFVQNYQVQLVAMSPNGCNDTISQNVVVYPEPNFNFNVEDQSACSPVSVTFPDIAGAVSSYWEFGDNTSSTASSPTHFYSNNTQEPIDYSVMMIGASAFGCVDTAYSTVTVYPVPQPYISTNLTSGCSPLEIEFENSSLGADSLFWDFAEGTTSNMDSSMVILYDNNGSAPQDFVVSLQVFNDYGCSGSTNRNIQVYPEVIAQFDHPESGCSPLVFSYDNQSTNAHNFIWNLGNGNVSQAAEPNAAYANSALQDTTFYVNLIATSTYGCQDTASSSVVVFPLPTASLFPDVTSGCAPLDVTFQNASILGDQFLWNYGDGFQSDTAAEFHTHTFNSSNTQPVTYTVGLEVITENGCTDETFQNINVFPNVDANFTSDSEGCTPYGVSFFNQSFGAITYFWDFGDGGQAFLSNPYHNFINNGSQDTVYTVQMIAESQFGCTDTATTEILVHPLPQVGFEVDTMMGCFPMEVSFLNYTENATSFEWDYGDGSPASSVGDSIHSHVYYNTTTEIKEYTVTLSATTEYGCADSGELEVQIIPEVIAGFNAPEEGCSPFPVSFENTSTGAFEYLWTYGDGDLGYSPEPDHIFSNTGLEDEVFTVTLIAYSLMGCADTVSADILIHAVPQANFTATPSQQQFPNSTVNVNNLTIAGPATYIWNWGDGSEDISNDPEMPDVHVYESWGQYEIVLTVDNGACSDQAIQTINIDPPLPIADFTGGGEGCVPVSIQFTNTSQYGVEYYWDFGDGTVSNAPNPIHTYYQPGVYNVILEVTGPGGETSIAVQQSIVSVYENAVAFFTINPPVVNIPVDPVFFNNLSQNASSFEWNFGDGNTSTSYSPTHYYASEGWFPVTLVANNQYNCPDTFYVDQAVKAKAVGEISFPNAFTPDPNGSSGGIYTIDDHFNNNIFFPIHKAVEEYQLQIFNRWGELLFETKDVSQGWDGYYRGNLCKQDVYVWKVKAKFADGNQIVKAGDVTLIR